MTPARLLTLAIEAFIVLFAVTVAHRLLSFSALAGSLPLASTGGGQALLVGLLSDLWVCFLASLFACLVMGLLAVGGFPLAARATGGLIVAALGFCAAMHQAYVEFFHFQIVPFHLRYLFDREFISANFGSVLDSHVLWLIGIFVAVGIWLLHSDVFRMWSTKRLFATYVALGVLCLIAHNRNIHYRVQWFVPENLQVNGLERLYLRVSSESLPKRLSPTELNGLATMLSSSRDSGASQPPTPLWTPEAMLHLLSGPSTTDASTPAIATQIHESFAGAIAAKRKPIFMTLLLESLRPSETGYFAPANGPSLTPALDDIAAHAVVFSHAYSTGSVTRGAQEAVLCGYLGSRDTSLMRGDSLAQITCIPDLMRDTGGTARSGEAFWYHGGDARFDGQVAYWQLHGIHQVLSLADFPLDAPRTGWGVGDRTFVVEAARRLADLHDRSTADYLLGLGLTVTNHVPWDLPADLPPNFATGTQAHPSYATTAYTDAAVGDFVRLLKASNLWSNTILVLVSDHGTALPPYRDIYSSVGVTAEQKAMLLGSHINLIVTGGLVDAALLTEHIPALTVDTQVSQADIAAFSAFTTDLPAARFMGQNLFRTQRQLPVLSALEENLYDHGSGHVFTRRDVVNGDANALPTDERKALLYYRAFLNYIYGAAANRR